MSLTHCIQVYIDYYRSNYVPRESPALCTRHSLEGPTADWFGLGEVRPVAVEISFCCCMFFNFQMYPTMRTRGVISVKPCIIPRVFTPTTSNRYYPSLFGNGYSRQVSYYSICSYLSMTGNTVHTVDTVHTVYTAYTFLRIIQSSSKLLLQRIQRIALYENSLVCINGRK